MIHPAFDISKEDLASAPDDCRLLIEVSGQAFNYILFSRAPDRLYMLRQYRIYTSSDKTNRDVLEEIISGDPILLRFSANASVVYNFPEATILPSDKFDAGLKTAVTTLMHGNTDHHFLFDEQVKDQPLRNMYFIARDLHGLCREKFRGSQYWHIYTIMLLWCVSPEPSPRPSARAVFYNDKFIVCVVKDNKLQLIQTFTYQTPEDAAYYLLLICKQLKIGQREIRLHISGLIDEQSALYSELLKFFEDVHHEAVPETYGTNGLLDEFPPHYFSPLLKMSLCV